MKQKEKKNKLDLFERRHEFFEQKYKNIEEAFSSALVAHDMHIGEAVRWRRRNMKRMS